MTQRLLGTAHSLQVGELAEALADDDIARGIHLINMAIDAGSDPRQFGAQVVSHLRNVMLAQTSSADLVEASPEERAIYEKLAARLERARLLKAIRAFNAAVNNYTGGWQPQLALELALIDSLQADAPPAAAAPAQARQPTARPQTRSEAAGGGAAPADEPATYERAAASPPGEKPVFSAAKIHERWSDLLAQVYRYNKNLPALLEHAHVRQVNGNRLILGVRTELFREKIAAHDRAKYIEQAIFDLHAVKLRIEVRVVDSIVAPEAATESEAPAVDDPLIAAGKELGGVVDE